MNNAICCLKKSATAGPVAFKILCVFFCYFSVNGCSEPDVEQITYISQKPDYNLLQIQPTSDTIHFPLNGDMNNAIRSLNLFSQNGIDYISFHDRRSESVRVYRFESKELVKSIALKNFFPGKKLYKTTVYCKNFDSIVVTNFNHIYLFDSSGSIKKTVNFVRKPKYAWATLENTNPPVFKDNKLYTGVRPYVKETSYEALREWKVVYEFDMNEGKAQLRHHLPQLYQTNIFGYHFMDYSYCLNDRGNFVFSFPADTNIYESDLTDHQVAYFAKSHLQKGNIDPVDAKELANKVDFFKSYLTRDSYGPIYFDSYNRRYLRIAKSRNSEIDYDRRKPKAQRIIIFNEEFKIVGESSIDEGVALGYLFFTKDGNIYARTKATDEYALHFVRLSYNYANKSESQLTLNATK